MDVLTVHNRPQDIAERTARIRRTVLEGSPHIREGNFTAIGGEDVEFLFHRYDEEFFGGWLHRSAVQDSVQPLRFRVSKTMTRSGGATVRVRPRGQRRGKALRYEIALAGRLLFQTFGPGQREAKVNGLPCADRLEAAMRVMEHEIIHLVEMVVWGASSCRGTRFKMLARNLFGHPGTQHELVTSAEQAAVRHGVRVGSVVRFAFQGRTLTGRVNRIHQRATVLVESPDGRRYSDGKHYHKYYVPLGELRIED